MVVSETAPTQSKLEGIHLNEVIIVALISGACTIIGTFGGILAGNSLMRYRLSQLEKKVDKHNSVIDRTYKLEQNQKLQEERQHVTNHRLDDLEK